MDLLTHRFDLMFLQTGVITVTTANAARGEFRIRRRHHGTVIPKQPKKERDKITIRLDRCVLEL
jgi:hypothetical protein